MTEVDAAVRAAARWGLSERQRHVLQLVLRGETNRAIAGNLGCAVNTVEYHVSVMLRKSGARARAELVSKAWREA